MTNRLSDTEIWEKDWFLDLTDRQKLLVKFLFDRCDCAGFYQISWNLLKCYFKEPPTREDFKKIKQVRFINENLVFIEDFALFQCKVSSFDRLNPNNNAHKGVLKLLEKHNIYKAPSEPLASPLSGAQEKEKEKDKEIIPLIEEEKEKEKEINPDLFFDSEIRECFALYEDNCKNLIPLRFEKKNREILKLLDDTLNEIDRDVGQFKQLCVTANQLRTIAEKKIDFKMMLRNYIGILNGKYKPPSILDGLDFG